MVRNSSCVFLLEIHKRSSMFRCSCCRYKRTTSEAIADSNQPMLLYSSTFYNNEDVHTCQSKDIFSKFVDMRTIDRCLPQEHCITLVFFSLFTTRRERISASDCIDKGETAMSTIAIVTEGIHVTAAKFKRK